MPQLSEETLQQLSEPSTIIVFGSGFLIGVIVALALGIPAFGRRLAQLLGVLLIGAGVALVAYAAVTNVQGAEELPRTLGTMITTTTEGYACGGGILAAGFVAVLISFSGRKRES